MKRITYILPVTLLILISPLASIAQFKTPPKIEWAKCFGGYREDHTFSIQETSDGGYIMAGLTRSFDREGSTINTDYEYYVLKLSSTGVIEWGRVYGGSEDDIALSIRQTNDGSYIMAGLSYSVDGDVKGHNGSDRYSDFWIVKLTAEGKIDWERSLGGTETEEAISIVQTFDGGYIVGGNSNSDDGMVSGNHGGYDCWIVKLSSNGTTEWTKSLGGSTSDELSSIQQTADSGYIMAGQSRSNDGDVTGHHGGGTGYDDYWIVKLSKGGSIEWQKSLGGSRADRARAIRQTSDNGYIVVGESQSIDGDVTGHHGNEGMDDAWIVKLDSKGSIEWDRSLGGSRSDYAFSVYETTDNGYVIAGTSDSYDGTVSVNYGGLDYWLVKLSNTGILEWEQSYGGIAVDWARSVQQTSDGGFIVAGRSSSGNNFKDGDVTGNNGGEDAWVVKLSPENPSSVGSESVTLRTVAISPNPASSHATLTLDSDKEGACEVEIISVTGATLKEYSTRLSIGKQDIALTDLESLPSGMYEVLVKRNGYHTLHTKLIIE